MNNSEIITKIKNLTPKTMILTMVQGLRNRHTMINMSTFGHMSGSGVCYGCAATNTMCELGAESGLLSSNDRSGFAHLFSMQDRMFIDFFENAIDILRRGLNSRADGEYFNSGYAVDFLSHLKLTNLRMLDDNPLPRLTDDYTEKDLQAYERFANAQEK